MKVKYCDVIIKKKLRNAEGNPSMATLTTVIRTIDTNTKSNHFSSYSTEIRVICIA